MYHIVENLKSDKAYYFYSGTTALYASLKAMGVGPGDEVIVPVFTCPAVPYPVVRLQATPIYTDIDPHTFNIDPNQVAAKITSKTKVIIAQHTFGIPAEMEPILDLARRHNLWVIEDACHALGSKYKGQEVGTFGDVAIYSFGWHKPLVLGTSGAAVVNNPILKPKVQELLDSFATPSLTQAAWLYLQYGAYTTLFTPSRFWAMKEIYRRLRDFKSGPRKGQIAPLIFGHSVHQSLKKQTPEPQPSTRSSEISEKSKQLSGSGQATETVRSRTAEGRKAIPLQKKWLFSKLTHLDNMIAHQSWVISQYKERLAQVGYMPFEPGNHLEPVYYKYPLLSERKREIFEKVQLIGLEMSDMFGSPLYPAERAANWKALGYRQGMCPISESISARIVALPVHTKIQAEQIEKTVAFLELFQESVFSHR